MIDIKTISFKYFFKFSESEEKVLDIRLDPLTLNLLPKKRDEFTEWTILDYSKCSICPYDQSSQKYCPIALNLTDVIETFSNKESYKTVDVRVITNEREYYKKTTVQTALSSVIGIYMVTSGCSIMNVLKPMVRHHLPFSSIDETIFRTTSSYLLGQYFLKKKGFEPDWELKKLIKAYEKIGLLNKFIVARFREASLKDANLNAIIILDVFAKSVPMTIEQTLSKIEYIFNSFIDF